MGKAVEGAKAGVVAGIPYAIFEAVTAYTALVEMKSTIMTAIDRALPVNSSVTPAEVYSIAIVAAPIVAVVEGIVGGVIVGAIYGGVFERIPGKTAIAKGIVVGAIVWLLLNVLGGLGNLQEGLRLYLADVVVGFVAAMLYGVLVGYFYLRFLPSSID